MTDRFDIVGDILKRLRNEFPEAQKRVAAEYCIRYLRTRRELYFKKARASGIQNRTSGEGKEGKTGSELRGTGEDIG